MAMDLLKEIAASRLPASFSARADVDKVRILRQAGLVIAWVPEADPPALSELGGMAQVFALTEKGREELLRFQCPCNHLAHSSRGEGMAQKFRTAMDRARKILM